MTSPKVRTAAAWHGSLQPPGHIVARDALYRTVTFEGTPADLEQPPLLEDIFCVHRGGSKRVTRRRVIKTTVHEMPDLALTIMPRLQDNRWLTEGPNFYTHIVVAPSRLDALLQSEFSLSRDQIALRDDVGFSDPLLCATGSALCGIAQHGIEPGRLFAEGLLTCFVIALFRSRSNVGGNRLEPIAERETGGLPAWRLKRILDYLEENILAEPGHEELTALAGCSRSHLFRAFREATGLPPGRYLEALRVKHAKAFIEGGASIDEAATRSGFVRAERLSRAFIRHLGMTPREYRRWYR